MATLAERIAEGMHDTSRTAIGKGLADQIRKATEETPDELIAGFTPDQQLGPAGLEDLTARLGIGTAESMKEKVAAFQKVFPNGDLRRTPVTNDLIFREDKTQPFAKVDAGLLEKFEPLGDIVDVVNGALVGDIAVTVASRGLNTLPFLFRLFLGSSAGKLAEEGIETARGTQDLDQGAIARDFGTGPPAEGTVAALGGAVGRPFDRGIVDVARGRGLAPMRPEAQEAFQSFKRLGLEAPTPGMVTSSPFIRLAERQSSAISGNIPELVAKQETGMVTALERARDVGNSDQFLAVLSRADDRERGRLLTNLRRDAKLKPGSITAREGGLSLKEGAAEYSQRSRKRVQTFYKEAEKIEEPVFDLSGLKNKARLMARVAEESNNPLDDSVLQVIKQIDEMETIPIRKVIREGDQEAVVTAGDQVRALRSKLFDLKTPSLGDTIAGQSTLRQPQAKAAELFSAVDDVLFNPTNNSQAFRKAWRKAGGEARKRFQTLESAHVLEALKTQEPSALTKKLAAPGKVDALLELRRAIPPKKFAEFREAFKTDLLNDPDNITKRLQAFDTPTLDLLLNRQKEIPAFVRYGASVDRLNKLPVRAIRESQANSLEAITTIANSVNPAEGRRLVDVIKRGSLQDKAVTRAALIDYLWKESVQQGGELVTGPKGRTFVNPALFKRAVEKLQSSGLGGFLGPADKTLVRDMQIVADFIGSSADPGTSLVAASIVRESTSVAGVLPGGQEFKVRPFIDFIQLHTIGRVLSSAAGRRIIGGLGTNPTPSKVLTVLGALSATMLANYSREQATKTFDLE